MQSKKQYMQLTQEFSVSKEHTNDSGALTICKTMREITGLYDLTIMLAFGDLNYYRILTSSYHIDFLGHAYTGDAIVLESEAVLYHGMSLEVSITVIKKGKKADAIISKGHFIFTLQTVEQARPFSLS